jgi:hypothetical protein
VSSSSTGLPPSVCGQEICRLTDDPWADSHPSWSPDGRQLVFDSDRSGTGQKQLYTMNAAGGEVRCLLCDAASNAQPAWSSTGLIAFQSNRSGSPQIYTMNSAGGEIRQITHQPGVNADPSWLPNGSEFAYTSGAPPNTQIFTIALAGGAPKQLTHDAQGDDELAAWSPDGTEILVSHREPVSNTGYMYAVEAGSGRPVANSTIAGFEGDWAPLPAPASTAAPRPSASPDAAVLPTPGRTAIARPLRGKVTVEPGHTAPPGGSSTAEPGGTATSTSLRGPVEVPVDSTYNATQGVVKLELTTVAAAKPSAVSAVIAGARFSVTQPHAAIPTVQLLGRPQDCARGSASAARRHSLPRIGLHTKGIFHGKGDFGKAGAGGTRWAIENTCQGTVYRAIQDDVTVTDPGRHKTIVLTAGHSYLVRPYFQPPRAASRR